MTKEAIAKAPERRVRRTPVGRRNVLTVNGKDPNYVYRIVNDTGDRVQAFLDAGYVFEGAKAVSVGDKRVGQVAPEGANAQVSVGQGVKAFVMKQRKEWYDEDQIAKAEQIKAVEDATKQKALDGTYGTYGIER
jgi:hypothetical protein